MNKNNTQNLGIRHGDVELYPLEKLPEGLKEIKHNGSFVLAEGETTGHRHVITAERLHVLQSTDGRYYLQLGGEGTVTHQEHKTLTVLPGLYEVGKEQEFDWFALSVKKVVD